VATPPAAAAAGDSAASPAAVVHRGHFVAEGCSQMDAADVAAGMVDHLHL
jgi:hypothetical protein